MREKLLGIYLNDHLAGSTIGLALARRTLNENSRTPFEPLLTDLVAEIAEDRRTLIGVMARLAVAPSRGKAALAWVAEKAGRLKPNGQVRGYSPLSRVLELEGLRIGVEGKRALWLTLGRLEDERLRDIDFDELVARASSQGDRLERSRLAASAEAFEAR